MTKYQLQVQGTLIQRVKNRLKLLKRVATHLSPFVLRRAMSASVLASLLAVATLWWWLENLSLRPHAFTTGWLLGGAVVFLALFGFRKKLPFLPLGSSADWLQLHIYVGFGAIWVFLLHTSFRFPTGVLESVLAAVYAVAAASGIYGLYLTRTLPRRLSALGEEVIWERIPQLRRQVAERARAIVLDASHHPSSRVMSDIYSGRLLRFFEGSRGWVYALRPTSTLRRQLLAELSELARYLSADEQSLASELSQLVARKDDLDYHAALQGWLKGWLFLHIGLTWSLLLLAGFHALMAHAFHGGMR